MNMTPWKRSLLVALLLASLAGVGTAAAQEAPAETTTAETTTEALVAEGAETAAEGEAHSEGEAAEESGAGPAENPLVPLGINLGFLIFQIVNFSVLFGLLGFFLWPRLMNLLDNRSATIAKGLEDAAAAASARRNAEAEAERIAAAARGHVARVVEEGRSRADEVARQIEAEARREADAIRAEARVRAEEERNRQLGELRGQVGAIAIAVSQQLIGASLDNNRQQALINDFFSKVPANARAMSGAQVEVVSAMPLSADEQQRVRTELGAQNVTFNVDPSILGGLIVRSSDRVIDGSVRNDLERLSSQLR
jgi:F-type H+-transporting ATPase subunit b